MPLFGHSIGLMNWTIGTWNCLMIFFQKICLNFSAKCKREQKKSLSKNSMKFAKNLGYSFKLTQAATAHRFSSISQSGNLMHENESPHSSTLKTSDRPFSACKNKFCEIVTLINKTKKGTISKTISSEIKEFSIFCQSSVMIIEGQDQ